jgi:hypothetical protein
MTKAEQSKFEKLMEIEGFDDELDFLEHCTCDSVVPGICMNEGCDYSIGVEPDSDSGWCDECQTNTIKSALVLKEII